MRLLGFDAALMGVRAEVPRPKAVLFDLYNTLIDIRTDEHDLQVWQSLARFLHYQGLIAEPETLRQAFFTCIRQQQRQSAEPHPEVDLVRAFGTLLHGLGYIGPEQFSLQITQLFRALSIRRFGLFPAPDAHRINLRYPNT